MPVEDENNTVGAETDPNAGGTEDVTDYKAEAEKWKALSRKHEANAKTNAAAATKLQEIEDSNKTEIEKAAQKAADAERRAAEADARALRAEIAAEKGLSPAQAKRLAGTTKEELEADADELLTSFQPADTGGTSDTGRPREALRGGASSAGDEKEEPLAEALKRIHPIS